NRTSPASEAPAGPGLRFAPSGLRDRRLFAHRRIRGIVAACAMISTPDHTKVAPEPMQTLRRKISLTLSIVFLAPVATKAMLWSFEEPRHWQTARWSSSGILPEAVRDPQARIVVFAARTAGWGSLFSLRASMPLEPAASRAATRSAMTRFRRAPGAREP